MLYDSKYGTNKNDDSVTPSVEQVIELARAHLNQSKIAEQN